ncbi:hypothetical protein [Microcoleus sp.]|uniref:hypothetical protein n=1 Tax=Microcoleus sp. TaxID=44472 RepID=UPI0035254CE4
MAINRQSTQFSLKLCLVMFSILGNITSSELLFNNSAVAQENSWGKILDLQQYCEKTKGRSAEHNNIDYQIDVEAKANELHGPMTPSAFRWACVSKVTDIHNKTVVRRVRAIDTQEACRMQYDPSYKARVGDENKASSWYCTRD